jgi:hypothetical protein
MSWAARQTAIREHYQANAPVAAARIDLSALNGKPFTPPALPALTSAMTAPQIAAARLAAVWIRLQILAVPRSGRAHTLGATAKTERLGYVLQSIFYPAGHGEDFGLATVVADAEAVFHRVSLSTARFRDTDEPDRIPTEPGAKFAQINVTTPFLALDAVAA